MDFTLKKVSTTDDIECLARLASEIWNQHFVPIIGQEQVNYMLEKFQSIYALTEQRKNGMNYLLAFEGDEAVGYCGFKVDENRVFLSKLYVKKDCRKRKLGRILFEKVHDFAQEQKACAIFLTVNKYNDQTIKIYEHIGFRTIESVVTDIGNGFVMDDYIMEYQL